ncbi:MAG TPA: S41 family peptidase [Flavobacteriaceae bacterium]
MKILKVLFIAIVLGGFSVSCFEDRDDNVILASEINDFVWKGMNAVYLYKDEIPNLANDRFSSDQQYGDYLNSYATPDDLFESLIYQRETVDRFSIIVDDYIELEQLLGGTFVSNGLEYNFYYEPGSNTAVFGIIRLVLNNSVASGLDLHRGQIFDAIDGTPLTATNLGTLLGQNTYTLNLANYNDNGTPEVADDIIESTTETVDLTKQPYTENPVHTTSIIDVNGEKLGYILYNGFNQNFNTQLNNAFDVFKTNNIQHLVIDLRYNPGGSVNTASLLGSMVTGQFNGQVFSKLIYNSDLQQYNSNYNFVNTFDGNAINSLNLSKVYVLTSSSSASASELVINSLKAYIDVVQIGDFTVGKTQASITVYDSPNLTDKENINPNHTYAMQPLVANSINVNDQAVPGNGLTPDIELLESPRNYGVLGYPNERLLAAAINNILGTGRFAAPDKEFSTIKTDVNLMPFEDEMYIDGKFMPPVLRKQFMDQ